MSRLYESMTNIQTRHFHIRVWRETEQVQIGPDKEIEAVCTEMFNAASVEYVMDKLLDLDRVNAVEVLDNEKNGVVGYNDWP